VLKAHKAGSRKLHKVFQANLAESNTLALAEEQGFRDELKFKVKEEVQVVKKE